MRPAEHELPLQHVLDLLMQGSARRGYAMYVRSLPLWAAPSLAEDLAATLPGFDRVLALVGPVK